MGIAAPRSISTILVLAIGGCGPQIVLEGDGTETDAGSTGAVATAGPMATSSPPSPGTTGPMPLPPGPGPTSGVVTSATDGGDVDVDVDDGLPPDDGCFFLCTPDGGGSFECDLFAQDCPRDQKCMPWANDGGVVWNATRCSPLSPGSAQVGEPCSIMGIATTGIDDCEIGAMCWNVDELGQGTCEDLCVGSAFAPDCASPSDRCVIVDEGALPLCLAACDPLAQDCAGAGESCVAAGEHWVCVPDGSDAPGAHGEPCDFINACDLATVCLGASLVAAFPGLPPAVDCDSGIGCCAAVCDASDPLADAACAALDPAHTCELWDDDMPPPGTNPALGVCRLAR